MGNHSDDEHCIEYIECMCRDDKCVTRFEW